MLYFKSVVLDRILKPTGAGIDKYVYKLCNKARFKNYIIAYDALTFQAEIEYDCFFVR